MFDVYKHYPFAVPFRTKVFNVFRFAFTIPVLERFLTLLSGTWGVWRKFIPQLYFYDEGSIRIVERNAIRYVIDISKLHGHSIYFCNLDDEGWGNLFKLLKPDFNIIDLSVKQRIITQI